MSRFPVILVFSLSVLNLWAQYPPPAGQEGSTAVHADSSVFIDWALYCEVNRGLMDISHPDSGYTTAGDNAAATGKADNLIVSLGDRGTAILTFNLPITNGPGPDFAVFENAFTDEFLELAFVEVSSNGVDYARFPSISLTQTNNQIEPYGLLDATKIHNLAGKYRVMYGVPFDLADIDQGIGINVNNITHVKIISVTGSINAAYADYDSQGNIINDPWPTLFPSSGFDLDAVGVIHNSSNGTIQENVGEVNIYPNPSHAYLQVQLNTMLTDVECFVSDITATVLIKQTFQYIQRFRLNIEKLQPGIYCIRVQSKNSAFYKKFIKK